MADASASSSVSGMRREGSFGGWLQRVRKTGEFSDILVRINGSVDFSLHTLPLRNASSFFRDLHSSPSSRSQDVAEVDLVGGPEAFSTAADFCYLIKPSFTAGSVGRVRSVAQQLGMTELLDSTKKYLYSNIFSHWKSSAAFLQSYTRFNDPSVDDYIESRCVKVIAAACTKAFSDTKHVSVPIPPAASSIPLAVPHGTPALTDYWPGNTTPCASLTEVLATVTARLPEVYMSQLLDTLVEAEVNLSLKCRQGRNVRVWLRHLIRDECKSNSSRKWTLICLSEMLLKSSSPGPRMELSSQYWCSLLEHVEEQAHHATADINPSSSKSSTLQVNHHTTDDNNNNNTSSTESNNDHLRAIQSQLEHRIGSRLHELDDYLQSYRFSAPTLLSLVRHFVSNRDEKLHQEQLEEVAAEVDGCLWAFAESPSAITAGEFAAIFAAFPGSCRPSHDPLFAAIERMLSRRGGQNQRLRLEEESEALWGLVDCDKLSPAVHEQAMNNPSFVCQPRVLERVLRMHSEELSAMGEGEDRQKLRSIMHKVIKASLKLLEENSRRSKEIVELQEQYTALLSGRGVVTGGGSSCENSPDAFDKSAVVHPEVEEEDDCSDEDAVESMDEEFLQQQRKKKKDEDPVGLEAPQTPMVEARRSLHCMSVGEIFAT